MLLGFNMLLWSTHVTEEHFSLFTKIKRAGFDGVELPVFEGTPEHFRNGWKGDPGQWPARDRSHGCPRR
jgi:hypothetical protein